MQRLTVILAVAALSLAACKKKASNEGAAPATGAVAIADAAPPAPDAATGSADGTAAPGTNEAGANRAGNCPSAVVGAETTVLAADKDKPATVSLSIVAKEAAATDTIRKRVAHLVEVQGAPDAEVKHTGDGTGGATQGKCPVVTAKDLKVSAVDMDGGSKVTIEVAAGGDAAALRAEVEKRIAATGELVNTTIKPTDASGGGGGVGGGKGDHGGNHSGDGDGQGKKDPPKDGDKAPAAPGAASGQAGGNKM